MGFLRAAIIYAKQKLQDNSSSQVSAVAAILISQLGICDTVMSCETSTNTKSHLGKLSYMEACHSDRTEHIFMRKTADVKISLPFPHKNLTSK